MMQSLEKQPLPSPHPERVHAPPATPTSEPPKPENDPNADNEVSVPYQQSPAGTPNLTPSPSRRKKYRKKEKPSSQRVTLAETFRPMLVLENSGSVARDHLASERTFLAYVRTSLLVASTGVALVQLFAVSASSSSATVAHSATLMRIQQFARPIGATLIIVGLVVLVYGVHRYLLIQTLLTKGFFPASRLPAVMITIALAIIILVIFGILASARN